MIVLLLAVIMLAPMVAAQDAEKPALERPTWDPGQKLRQRGQQLLDTAETESRSLGAGMRAFNLQQIARVYLKSDRKRAQALLEDAFASASDMDEVVTESDPRLAASRSSKGQLQAEIVELLASLDAEKAEELLPQIPSANRDAVVRKLLEGYRRDKQYEHATRLVLGQGEGRDFPYNAAQMLISAMPNDMAMERQQLFAAALRSFRDLASDPKESGWGMHAFTSLVSRCWRDLPRQLVREALDAILALPEGARGQTKLTYGDRNVVLEGAYEYRLFHLWPVLREFDPTFAKAALDKAPNLRAVIERYPEGIDTLSRRPRTPSGADVPARPGATYIISERGQDTVFSDMDTRPEEAMAKAEQVLEAWKRASAFQAIAEANVTPHPDIARKALKKVRELPNLRADDWRNVASIYIRLEDTETALECVKKGMAPTKKTYARDSDIDDPNRALKAYWPSAHSWRGLLRVVAQLSPEAALEMLEEIPDPEIKATERIALASAWLGVPPSQSPIIVVNKTTTRPR